MAYQVEEVNTQPTTGYQVEEVNTQPLQGGVSTWQMPSNIGQALTDTTPLSARPQTNPYDVLQSTASGLAENVPFLGKAMEYKPKTFAGNAGKVVGNVAPWLMGEGEANVLGQAAMGGYQGFTNSLNRGDNPYQIAENTVGGAAVGALTNPVIKGIGKTFEEVQPSISQFLSKIPKEDYQTILDSIKRGENPFAGKATSLENLQGQAEEFATNQKTNLSNLNNEQSNVLSTQKRYNTQQEQDFNNKAQTELNLHKENAKQVLQSLKDMQLNEATDAVQSATDLAHSTSNTIQQVQKQYGKAVGQQANALKDADNIPLKDITSLIDSNINNAAQNTEINPVKDLDNISSLDSQLKSMLMRGALKNQGLNDSQINAYLAQKGAAVEVTSSMEQTERENLTKEGFSPTEIDDRIDMMKDVGLIGKQGMTEAKGIPPVDEDNLEISQKGLHVLKQYLQSRKINYEAQSNPVSGVVKNIVEGINGTLRDANPNYAAANDKYSELAQFLNKPENAFFNNSDQMASKFSNISKNSAITSDTMNKVKHFESIAQEAGLGQKISNDLEGIKSIPDKHAQQKLDLENGLAKQKQQILNKHAQQMKQLQDELTGNTVDLNRQNAGNLSDFTNNQSNELNIFNQNQQIPLARTSFDKFSPSSVESTLSGFASPFTVGSALFGHPQALIGHALYSGARSPLTQKALLQGYGKILGMGGINPYLPQTTINAYQQYMNNQGQR